MQRMKKSAPEVVQTIRNFHFEKTEDADERKDKTSSSTIQKKQMDKIDAEILADRILKQGKANSDLEEYLGIVNKEHAHKLKLMAIKSKAKDLKFNLQTEKELNEEY